MIIYAAGSFLFERVYVFLSVENHNIYIEICFLPIKYSVEMEMIIYSSTDFLYQRLHVFFCWFLFLVLETITYPSRFASYQLIIPLTFWRRQYTLRDVFFTNECMFNLALEIVLFVSRILPCQLSIPYRWKTKFAHRDVFFTSEYRVGNIITRRGYF